MTELEIKDLESAATYRIGAQGAVIGREGAKADIVLRNPSVSKRHAKIYADNGAWFLEDLGSSNGTFLDSERISEPVELMPGTSFALAEIQFEVLRQIGGAASESTDNELPPVSAKGRAFTDPHRTPEQDRRVPQTNSGRSAPELGPPPMIEAQAATGFPALLAAIPKAMGHYLVAIPKLAINPIGTVRSGVQEQPHPPMDAWQLIGWALPVMIFNALVGFVCTLIFQLVKGTLSIGSILPLEALVGAVIGSVLVGLLWHPIVRFIVKFLKGSSDERSRTNWFIMSTAGSALVTIPSGLVILMGLLNVPFIGVAPVLLGLAATLIGIFIGYSWLVQSNVVRWFQYLVLAVGVLTILSSGKTAFDMASGGGSPALAGQDELAEQARRMAEAAAEGAEGEGLAADMLAKLAAAKPAMNDDDEGPLAEATPTPPPAKDPPPAKEPPPVKEPPPTRRMAEPESAAPPEPIVDRMPSGGYPAFAAKRDAVERMIAEDPTVLKRPGVLPIYERYLKAKHEVTKAWGGKKSKAEPWKQPLNDRLRDVELYEKTGKIVDELHMKLPRR